MAATTAANSVAVRKTPSASPTGRPQLRPSINTASRGTAKLQIGRLGIRSQAARCAEWVEVAMHRYYRTANEHASGQRRIGQEGLVHRDYIAGFAMMTKGDNDH